MINGYLTYQLAVSRINELHEASAAERLANEVAHGRRRRVPTLLVRLLRARRGRVRGPQPQAASDAR